MGDRLGGSQERLGVEALVSRSVNRERSEQVTKAMVKYCVECSQQYAFTQRKVCLFCGGKLVGLTEKRREKLMIERARTLLIKAFEKGG